jgi:hypothetical protein
VAAVTEELLGGYGEKLSGSAVTPLITVNNRNIFNKLEKKPTLLLETRFFIAGKTDSFVPISKKTLLKHFSTHQNKISNYLKENYIRFTEKSDLIKLFSFLQTI